MSARYTVDSDAISAHSRDTGALVSELETALSNLNAKLTALQGLWKGSASTNYSTLMGQWHSDMNKMKSTLSQISQALAVTSTEYATAEDTNTRRWMSV